ncbi:MAG: MarR family transcriptional regulator, partial [Lachnospiraceae bacterium]|nr:MarR family transcriptional regulator [Lachnospiraceae bacterium]
NYGLNLDLNTDLSEVERLVLEAVSVNPSVSVAKIVADFSIPRASVERAVKSLKEKELLARVGSRKSGKWVIRKQGHDGL